MGELHLEVLVDRMMREFTVSANVGKPQVAYRETITVPVEKVEERYVRQTGGRGQYGHVIINLEPTGPGRRLRVRRQGRPAATSRASTSPPSTPASSRRWRAA